MIRSIYAFTGKVAYWLTSPLLFLISLRAKPRVRVIVASKDGEILLIRNWYGRQRWTLPGGGMRWHEPPVEAARRELREELGLDLPATALHPLGTIDKYDKTTPFQATVFSTYMPPDVSVYRHPLELIDFAWVSPKKLPKNTHSSVTRALSLWKE